MVLTQKRLEAYASVTYRLALGLTAGGVWVPVAGNELVAPVAVPASGVCATGFTANWVAVSGATGYCLDVYTFDGVPPTSFSEGFDDYPGTLPEGWEISNSGGAYTTAGNFGAAAPSVKLESSGQAITTPVYPVPVTNFSYWFRGLSVSNSTLRVDANHTAEWVTLETVAVSNSAAMYSATLTAGDGYTRFRLVYDKEVGNVAVDDVAVSFGNATNRFILANVAVGNVTAYTVTNLVPGVYRYAVRATQGALGSGDSNVVEVNTEAQPQPPVIGAMAPQSIHVGERLACSLEITATENDPVTATNVSASAGVAGEWSLVAGHFVYCPAAEDEGQRVFTFSAQDKDGWSDAVSATVTVLRARMSAVRMSEGEGTYVQAFDALAVVGSPAWDNAAVPLEACYAFANNVPVTFYKTGYGSGTSGGLYSFGAEQSSDRSLGSLASAGNTYRYGLALTNETGQAVTNLTVCFMAEQWRVGSSALTNTLTFDYCITNRVLPLYQGVWRRVKALCFHTPLVTNEDVSAGAVYEGRRLAATLTRPVAPFEVVLLRWSDPDDPGIDHACGIDDLNVSWVMGAMPDAIVVGRAGVVQTFDGVDEQRELPFLWRVETRDDAPRVSGAYADAACYAMNENTASNFTASGSYRFTAGTEDDYAFGGLADADTAKSVSVSAKFRNGTGFPLRHLIVRYAVEKYRHGLKGCAIRLLSSTDGVVWMQNGVPVAFPADADTYGCAREAGPLESTAVERSVVFSMPILPGGLFYLAWQYAVMEGDQTADSQALGIDDVQIVPVFAGRSLFTVR